MSSLISKGFSRKKSCAQNEKKTRTFIFSAGIIFAINSRSTTMILTIILLTITVLLLVGYMWSLKSRCNYFKKRGLPGPPPVFFFGHYQTLWSLLNLSEQLRQWTQQYGSIYGLFEGTRPMYVVSDVKFLHEVFVKQFASFNARSIPFLMKTVRNHQVHMFGASGITWRRQRHVISPTFSAAKLRLMSSLGTHCIQSLMDKLKIMEKKGEQFNIYELYRRLTMDIICKYFSLETFAFHHLRKE
jgi:thromboxane-A synthase